MFLTAFLLIHSQFDIYLKKRVVKPNYQDWIKACKNDIVAAIFRPLQISIREQLKNKEPEAQLCLMIGGSCLLKLVQDGWSEVFPKVKV